MAQYTFNKSMQGSNFRVEVAYVAPPRVTLAPEVEGENPPAGLPEVGQELMIETDVLGYGVGTSVEFMIFEPHRLHEAPIETLTGTTEEETRGVSVNWTFDYAANKDSIHFSRFVVVARVGNLTSICEPFEVLQRFERELSAPDGGVLSRVRVLLRAAGRDDVPAETDAEGKLNLLVPPGDYLVEVLGPRKG